jgi:isochorismate pyruvate lyase
MSSDSETVQPEDCTNMTEVREGVDAVDRTIVDLLATRFAYMDAAARIKSDRNAVRDEARKAQVLDNVRAAAKVAHICEELVAGLWDQLVEASIAYEYEVWDERNSVS